MWCESGWNTKPENKEEGESVRRKARPETPKNIFIKYIYIYIYISYGGTLGERVWEPLVYTNTNNRIAASAFPHQTQTPHEEHGESSRSQRTGDRDQLLASLQRPATRTWTLMDPDGPLHALSGGRSASWSLVSMVTKGTGTLSRSYPVMW